MNRITKATGLTLFALLVLTAPVAAQVNVAGKWTLLLESPQGPAELIAVLEQDGATVTGVLELELAEGVEMTNGMIEENKLTFILDHRQTPRCRRGPRGFPVPDFRRESPVQTSHWHTGAARPAPRSSRT